MNLVFPVYQMALHRALHLPMLVSLRIHVADALAVAVSAVDCTVVVAAAAIFESFAPFD